MTRTVFICLAAAALSACHGVRNDAEARYAYIGLEDGVDRAMALGLQGFNLASSANIDPQHAAGDAGGSMVVDGQADQGASDNKQLRLEVTLTDYQDEVLDDMDHVIRSVYTTAEGRPLALDLSLRGIPDGTVTGTFAGAVLVSKDLEGDLALDLAIAGDLEPVPGGDGAVRLVAGETRVTGTATSDYGVFDVDVTR